MIYRLETDRRQFHRTNVAWPVSMLTPKGSIEGTIENISLDGAFIHCREVPDLNKPVRLGIEMPEYQHAVLATGRIVRSEAYHDDSTSPSYGLGLCFTEIAKEDLRFFHDNRKREDIASPEKNSVKEKTKILRSNDYDSESNENGNYYIYASNDNTFKNMPLVEMTM